MEALITADPNVALGKPLVRGTRITVEHILESLAAGESEGQLLTAHPRRTPAGVRAALRYAADVLRSDVILPAGKLCRVRCVADENID